MILVFNLLFYLMETVSVGLRLIQLCLTE